MEENATIISGEKIAYYGFRIFEVMADIRTRFSDRDNLKNLTKSCLRQKSTLRLLEKLVSKIDQNKVIKFEDFGTDDEMKGIEEYTKRLNFLDVIKSSINEIVNLDELSKETGFELDKLTKEEISLDEESSANGYLFYANKPSISFIISFTIKIGDLTDLDCQVFIDTTADLYRQLKL